MDLVYIFQVVLGFLGIFLLALTYTYIEKLEKTGCACSEHPYRNFIKKYCIFAIVFLAVIMFVPTSAIAMLGPVGASVVIGSKILFGIITVVFYVMAIIYVRYLMKEKCKCSEDMRREVLYIWAILEIIIIASAVLMSVMIWMVTSGTALASSAIKEGSKHAETIMDATVNPIKSVKKVPANIKKSLKLRK